MQGDSAVQTVSASNVTGQDVSDLTSQPIASYSFDPGDPSTSNSDTSVCLLVSFQDFSRRNVPTFTMIFNLPLILDSGSRLNCPLTTGMTELILDFETADFTTNDAGMIGSNYGKKGRFGGIWSHEFADGTRSKLIRDGGSVDWSNYPPPSCTSNCPAALATRVTSLGPRPEGGQRGSD